MANVWHKCRRYSTRSKGQLELNILTKMAMLFFIISLSFIALNISNTEKSALCGEQALATGKIIASNINQALSAPVEDVRIVYKFEQTIAVSKDKFGERYEVLLAEHENPESTQFSVIVKPSSDASCERRVNLLYDKSKVQTEFFENGNPVVLQSGVSPGENVVVLKPSDRDLNKRTKFLVILKCTDKSAGPGGIVHVKFDNCGNPDASACSPITTCGA